MPGKHIFSLRFLGRLLQQRISLFVVCLYLHAAKVYTHLYECVFFLLLCRILPIGLLLITSLDMQAYLLPLYVVSFWPYQPWWLHHWLQQELYILICFTMSLEYQWGECTGKAGNKFELCGELELCVKNFLFMVKIILRHWLFLFIFQHIKKVTNLSL